ncbi:MAG TPA: hypothetical protein VFQ42_22200 [Mycobacterium sp.]|nr:hypothetical protein [Mycobacterium sp.]
MRKSTKLKLRPDTLRLLAGVELRGVAGGDGPESGTQQCNCPAPLAVAVTQTCGG